MNGLIYRSTVTFLPLYLSQRINVTFLNFDAVMIAGAFTTVALIFGVGGQFLGGHLLERRRHEILAFGLALVGIPLLLAMGNSQGMVLMLASASFAFFHFAQQPVYNNLVADYSPASWRGRMYGLSFFFNFGLGSFSASILGYVADQLGTNWVFNLSAGFGVLVLICAIALLAHALRGSRDKPPVYHIYEPER